MTGHSKRGKSARRDPQCLGQPNAAAMIGSGDHNVAGAPRQGDDRGAVGSQVWSTLRVIRPAC